MKKTRITAIAVLAAITCSLFVSTGCKKVQELANEAENAVSNLGDKVKNFEDNITGGTEAEASQLDSVLKDFYSGIKSGIINETNAGYLVTATLPSNTATQSKRNEAVKTLTVYSAIEWQGMTARFNEETLSKFVFSGGSVRSAGSSSGKPITLQTTLGELFG